MIKRNSNSKGFTLIELLVVVAILSLVGSMVLASINDARKKARDSKRIADLAQVSKALSLYYSDHNEYPAPHDLNLAQNWSDLLVILYSGGYIARADFFKEEQFTDSFWSKIIPSAFALNTKIQDPLYSSRSYGYMPSSHPLNQNFRLRAQLENINHFVLASSLGGAFLYTDKFNGQYACDKNLGFYCISPEGDFLAFDPGKPVIYLYPTEETNVSVRVWPKQMMESVPQYLDGWDVIAFPNGDIYNPKDDKKYPYLFWEGKSDRPVVDRSMGFVVDSGGIENFLEEKLKQQGLNKSEISDFVEYWAPRMKSKLYVYVYFMPQSDYDALVPFEINPKPDTVIRVYMLFKSLDKPINVEPQEFSAPERRGFTMVEWGGDRSELR